MTQTGKAAGGEDAKSYILVHGAWFGGWVWQGVAEGLRAMGHIVFAPSLTGLGDRRHLRAPGVNLSTHADDVIDIIERERLDNVVLVGWSYGGMVIAEVLARMPDRIGSMVYLDAFVPERGWSAMDYTMQITDAANATEEQRRDAHRFAHMVDDLEPSSFDIMGVSDRAIIDLVAPQLSLHPIGTMTQPSGALDTHPAHIPHLFVLAGASPSAALFGPFMERAAQRENFSTVTLDTSHLMMLTAPQETLRILAAVDVRAA